MNPLSALERFLIAARIVQTTPVDPSSGRRGRTCVGMTLHDADCRASRLLIQMEALAPPHLIVRYHAAVDCNKINALTMNIALSFLQSGNNSNAVQMMMKRLLS